MIAQTYPASRPTSFKCLHVFQAIAAAYPAGAEHPLIARKFKGVTLYRRLLEVINQPSFRPALRLLLKALSLLLTLCKMSTTFLKQGRGYSCPEVIAKRLRFGTPAVMKLARFLAIKVRRDREQASMVHMSQMVRGGCCLLALMFGNAGSLACGRAHQQEGGGAAQQAVPPHAAHPW